MTFNFDQTFSDRISVECIKKFESLGKSGKPGKNEWTVLACVVKCNKQEDEVSFEVVSLGTGSKCIGERELPENGDRLHDSHAEVIAKRAFKYYLLEQLNNSIQKKTSIFYFENQGFGLKENISFHFYSSNVPCGDASIFSKTESVETPVYFTSDDDNGQPAKKRKVEEECCSRVTRLNGISEEPISTRKTGSSQRRPNPSLLVEDIYRTGAKCANKKMNDPKKSGLEYHIVGVLRTKPGRGNPTLSHCCSDKMFKWTVLGIQGGLLMLFLKEPVYLETITIGSCPFDRTSLRRALFSRFQNQLLTIDLTAPFRVQTPHINSSSISFLYSKPTSSQCKLEPNKSCKPSAASIIWSDTLIHNKKIEVSISGKRLGTTKKNENSPKSRVSICRVELLRKVFELFKSIEKADIKSNNLKKNCLTSVSWSYNKIKNIFSPYENTWKLLCDNVLVDWTRKPEKIREFVLDECGERETQQPKLK